MVWCTALDGHGKLLFVVAQGLAFYCLLLAGT